MLLTWSCDRYARYIQSLPYSTESHCRVDGHRSRNLNLFWLPRLLQIGVFKYAKWIGESAYLRGTFGCRQIRSWIHRQAFPPFRFVGRQRVDEFFKMALFSVLLSFLSLMMFWCSSHLIMTLKLLAIFSIIQRKADVLPDLHMKTECSCPSLYSCVDRIVTALLLDDASFPICNTR